MAGCGENSNSLGDCGDKGYGCGDTGVQNIDPCGEQNFVTVYEDPCDMHGNDECCVPSPRLPPCPEGNFVERVQPIRPDRSYVPPSMRFNGVTTYRVQYNPKPIERIPSFKPPNAQDTSCAPMVELTTYRQAYTPKPIAPLVKPPWAKKAQFNPGGARMDAVSSYRIDYPGYVAERVRSLKPAPNANAMSTGRLEGVTTYKLSYIPYCNREYRYARQPKSSQMINTEVSCAKLEGLTTYKADFWEKGFSKRKTMKPSNKTRFSDARFGELTTYRNDYIPFHFTKCVNPCIPVQYPSQQC